MCKTDTQEEYNRITKKMIVKHKEGLRYSIRLHQYFDHKIQIWLDISKLYLYHADKKISVFFCMKKNSVLSCMNQYPVYNAFFLTEI